MVEIIVMSRHCSSSDTTFVAFTFEWNFWYSFFYCDENLWICT